LLVIARGMALAHGLPVVITTDEVCFNQDLRGLVPHEHYVPRFVYYSLLGARHRLDAHIDKAAHGTARLVESAYNERLWMPDRSTQERIVAYLDDELQRIDDVFQRLETFKTLLEEERISDLEPLCFPVPEGPYWFGSTPRGWETRTVASLGSLFDGDWIESPYITDEGIRLIQTGNIGRGTFRGSSERFISDETFVELKCSEILPDDVLFSRLNLPMARACLAPSLATRMIASVDVAVLRAVAVSPRWLVALASTERWLGWMEQQARGTTMARVARSQLAQVRVPVPPPRTQDAIGRAFGAAIAKASRQSDVVTRMRTRLVEYRHALIAEAVAGPKAPSASDADLAERVEAVLAGEVAS
jgi:type I restriction enzyme S subunit